MTKRIPSSTRVRWLILVSFCGLSLGCGGSTDEPKLAQATGVVMFQDKPLPDATVTFIPKNGPIAIGHTDEEGAFSFSTGPKPGAVIGSGTVTVICLEGAHLDADTESNNKAETDEDAAKAVAELEKQADAAAATESESPKSKSIIPAKYSRPRLSGLTATVAADPEKNEFRFVLVD